MVKGNRIMTALNNSDHYKEEVKEENDLKLSCVFSTLIFWELSTNFKEYGPFTFMYYLFQRWR